MAFVSSLKQLCEIGCYTWCEPHGPTCKRSATMSQSAECGAAVVPEWYASLPKHSGRRGEVSYFKKLFMENMLLANYTD